MRLRLIRNATLHIRLGGKYLLVDPMLDPGPPELPEPAEVVVKGVDAVIVTGLEPAHLDATAVELLPADVPCFGPIALREHGFTDVRPVDDAVEWEGVRIVRAAGGFVLAAEGEPVLYLTGDAVSDEAVNAHDPDVVVIGADTEDVVAVARRVSAPQLVVIDVDSPVTRADLHQRLHEEGLAERVTVPEDGAAVPV
jgi:L-ascorbate metabolism protein UlaG (beta-lactamase superfamily)